MEDFEKEKILSDISVSSRMKFITNEKAKKAADFLIGYCFEDNSEGLYSGGIVLVPMYRVLDALSMIDQKEIVYGCE